MKVHLAFGGATVVLLLLGQPLGAGARLQQVARPFRLYWGREKESVYVIERERECVCAREGERESAQCERRFGLAVQQVHTFRDLRVLTNLSLNMYLSISFRKSTPPQNRQLIVYYY